MTEDKQNFGSADFLFMGFHRDGGKIKKYPSWRYHKTLNPIIVNNREEDLAAKERGYEEANPPVTANSQIHNWFWDLEDMSPRQLCVFAKDEYGVDLPEDAGQEKLVKVIVELSKHAPQNRGRMVFMAHTIRMNYDETLETIRKMAENATEVTRMEFTA